MASTVSSPFPVKPLVSQVIVPASQTLTDAATIATDASLGEICVVTLGGNRTLGTPTNPMGGQRLVYLVKQDGTGNRTLAYSAAFTFGSSTTPVVNPTASATTLLEFVYDAAQAKWVLVSSSAPNNDLSSIVSGTVTVANGTTAGTAAIANANGKPVVATIKVQGAASRYVIDASIAAGTLTVNLSGDPGAGGATVNYIIDKR
jgi:hypothetical protein